MSSTCKLWTGTMWSGGYGRVGARGIAHRIAYEKAYGPIPKDLIVRHTCDVKACVNPEHLLLGTLLDNTHDMITRGRKALGSAVNRSQLTAVDIPIIRASKETCKLLGKHYGVTDVAISLIKRKVTWKHIL